MGLLRQCLQELRSKQASRPASSMQAHDSVFGMRGITTVPRMAPGLERKLTTGADARLESNHDRESCS